MHAKHATYEGKIAGRHVAADVNDPTPNGNYTIDPEDVKELSVRKGDLLVLWVTAGRYAEIRKVVPDRPVRITGAHMYPTPEIQAYADATAESARRSSLDMRIWRIVSRLTTKGLDMLQEALTEYEYTHEHTVMAAAVRQARWARSL